MGQEAAADRVRLVDAPACIRLYTSGEVRSGCDLRNTVEQKISQRVRREVQVVVVAKQRDLSVEVIDVLLIRQHSEIADLLWFSFRIELLKVVTPFTLIPSGGICPGELGNLKLARIRAGHKAEPGIFIEDPCDMCEAVELIRGVMQGIIAGHRIIDSSMIVM